MKRNFSKIFGVGLTVILLASMMVMGLPASASTLAWGTETLITTTDNLLGPSGVDIVDMAVNGNTIYVVTGTTASNITYKSTDAGAKWSSLATTTDYPNESTKLAAVAADDANVVALVTASNNVSYSTNGGSSWSNLGMPTGADIRAIDISPLVAGVRYVVIAGTDGVDAELWTMKLAMAEAWTARAVVADGFSASGVISAVKFSPNFASDKVVACITAGANSARLQVFRLETGLYKWNNLISWFGTDWTNGAVVANITGSTTFSASLAITPAYVGSDLGTRLLYVGIATDVQGSGVYRVNDIVSKGFETWSGGDEGPIFSVAYHSSGKLLAGRGDTSMVYVALTPTASTPQFERTTNYKQPGGAGMVRVAWSGTTAVAGTRGDESAFAVSTDNGITFNDISLIDTTLSTMTDFAIDSAGSKWYLATYSGNDVSIWLKDGTWSRVFSMRDAGSLTYLIRLAPTDYKTIYLAQQGGTQMWVSKDAGKASWKDISVYGMSAIKDFAVQSADIAYVIDTSGCVKTTNGGTSWGEKKTLDSVAANMITLAPNNDVLVGGTDGYIAFSKDGGATFTKTKILTAGNVYVAADDAYATNNIIYGAVGTKVYRTKADTSTTASSRGPGTDAALGDGQYYVGIAVSGNVTYALSTNSTVGAGDNSSRLYRALNLETADTSDLAEWGAPTTGTYFNYATYTLGVAPQALKLSSGPKLWAIRQAASLASLTDPVAVSSGAPTMVGPASGFLVTVNPSTGRAYNVTFTFKRYADSKVDAVRLQIATDSAFTAIVWDSADFGNIAISSDTAARVIGPTGSGFYACDFMPGTTYYWRVRSVTPVWSAWSTGASFKVETAVAFSLTAPEKGAYDVPIKPTLVWSPFGGAIYYQVQIGTDASLVFPDIDKTTINTVYQPEESLTYDTTYYWRVRGVTGPADASGALPGSDWVTGIFSTMAEPKEPTPAVVTITEPAPPPTIVTIEKEVPAQIPSYLLWIIIVIGAILVIALIVLIVRTRRVA